MNKIESIVRNFGRLTMAGLLAGIVLTGTTAVQADESVRASDDGLLEGLFQTEIVNIGLERLGYDVGKVRHMDIPAMHVAVGQGETQFTAVHWEPLQNVYFDKAGGSDAMTKLGTLVAGASQGYLIDKKTAEKYGITSIEQLKDPAIARIFDTDGDDKADLAGCPPGWGCERVIEHHMDAYGLRDTVTHNQGQFMVMAADSVSRYRADQPVLYYTYAPLWVSQVLRPGQEVVWLEVPFTSLPDKSDEEAKAENTMLPDGRNVGFTVNAIRIVANNDFLADNPSARKWFELVSVPIEDVNHENFLIHEGEDDLEDIRRHAEDWVARHEDQVSAWLEEARKAAN